MYNEHYYCIKCGKYYSSRHKCGNEPIFIAKETRAIVDRLHCLGFEVMCTRFMPDTDHINITSYLKHLEVHFKITYSEWLLQELPDGWLWQTNMQAFEPTPYLIYTAEIPYGTDERVIFDRAIKSLEEYLNSRNQEGIAAAMLLMYD